MTRYDLLRRTWLAAGVAINDGATRVAVARFEKERHLVLPGGFREYLLTVNGMRDWETDEEALSFFSLERIDQETNEVETGAKAGRLVIADFLTFSHCYVLRIGQDGDDQGIWAYDRTNERLLAPSFDVFVEQILPRSRIAGLRRKRNEREEEKTAISELGQTAQNVASTARANTAFFAASGIAGRAHAPASLVGRITGSPYWYIRGVTHTAVGPLHSSGRPSPNGQQRRGIARILLKSLVPSVAERQKAKNSAENSPGLMAPPPILWP